MADIKNYYFTYGTHKDYPYVGGWTKIEAQSRKIATEIFRYYHPDKHEGIINCCDIYTEEQFHETEMWSKGNLGSHEHEVILMQHIELPW